MRPQTSSAVAQAYANSLHKIEEIAAEAAFFPELSFPQRALVRAIAMLAKHKPYKIVGTQADSYDVQAIGDDLLMVSRSLDQYSAAWGSELSSVFVKNYEDADAVDLKLELFAQVVTKGMAELVDYLDVLSDSLATFTGRMSIKRGLDFWEQQTRGWRRYQ